VTLASIPSPASGVVHAGPFTIHMYGLMLLAGIGACIWLTGVRWRRLGGEWELVLRTAVWGVAFGVVGARIYHVATSWDEVPSEWWGVLAVWRGGLGIWGGIALGALAGSVVIRRAGANVAEFANAVAPGILLAQGIGRWGNWWNQELFGGPTSLPWGLEISPSIVARLPPEYQAYRTFHPTFLYEFLWDLAMVVLMLRLDRRTRIRPPAVFALRGAAARRSLAPHPRPAGQLLRLGGRLRRLDGALRSLAAPRWRGRCGRARPAAALGSSHDRA